MAPTGAAAVAPESTNENDSYTVPGPFGAAPVPTPIFPDQVRAVQAPEQGGEDQRTDEELTGDALTERARELDIKGRSTMDADELRAAVADAEAGGT